MVSQDLLEILRCPVCVHNEPEGGELEKRGNWLICQDCGRKYPIRDDIPVMLVEEGDRFRGIPVDELPETPPPEEPQPVPTPPVGGAAAKEDLLPYLLLGVAGLLVGLFVFWLIRQRCCSEGE
jgi:uncharacterized protein YbaR (Trm112 family)